MLKLTLVLLYISTSPVSGLLSFEFSIENFEILSISRFHSHNGFGSIPSSPKIISLICCTVFLSVSFFRLYPRCWWRESASSRQLDEFSTCSLFVSSRGSVLLWFTKLLSGLTTQNLKCWLNKSSMLSLYKIGSIRSKLNFQICWI